MRRLATLRPHASQTRNALTYIARRAASSRAVHAVARSSGDNRQSQRACSPVSLAHKISVPRCAPARWRDQWQSGVQRSSIRTRHPPRATAHDRVRKARRHPPNRGGHSPPHEQSCVAWSITAARGSAHQTSSLTHAKVLHRAAASRAAISPPFVSLVWSVRTRTARSHTPLKHLACGSHRRRAACDCALSIPAPAHSRLGPAASQPRHRYVRAQKRACVYPRQPG